MSPQSIFKMLLLSLFFAISVFPAAFAQSPGERGAPPTSVVRPADQGEKLTPRRIYQRLLHSTGWILVTTPSGKVYSGTGWIVDAQKRLLVTCHHVIARSAKLSVHFPKFRQGQLLTDARSYRRSTGVRATLVDSDPRCDLALIQLPHLPEYMKGLQLAKISARPADPLHVVGGKPRGSEALWTYGNGVVRSVNLQTIANGHRIRVLQSQDGSDRGNSGGAVLSDRGHVVAVVHGGVKSARNVGLNIDVSELQKYLRVGLKLVSPQDKEGFAHRGERHSTARRFEQALADFNEALKFDRSYVRALVGRGWALYRKGNKQTALADFDEAIKLQPDSVPALRGRFFVNRSLKRYTAALADINRALRQEPRSWQLYNLRGNCYFTMSRYQESVDDYSRAIKIDPHHYVLWSNRGGSRVRLGRYSLAERDLAHALKLNRRHAYSWMNLGISRFKRGQYVKALPAFLLAVLYQPTDANKHAWLGTCQQKLGRHAAAIKTFSSAIRLRKHSFYYFSRGVSRARLQQWNSALVDLDRAISLNNQVASYYHERSLVRKKLQLVGYAADARRARTLDPRRFGNLPQRAAPVAIPVSVTKVKTKVDGRWHFQGSVGRTHRKMLIEIRNGKYTFAEHIRQADNTWLQIRNERGKSTLLSNQIQFQSDALSLRRRYRFQDGFLYLRVAELGYDVPFQRQP